MVDFLIVQQRWRSKAGNGSKEFEQEEPSRIEIKRTWILPIRPLHFSVSFATRTTTLPLVRRDFNFS